MLGKNDNNELSDKVFWNEKGDTFYINDTKVFEKDVLPKYFECTLASFRRQLNYYGFVRVNDTCSASNKMIFKHQKFLKGRDDLLGDIRRSTCHDPKYEVNQLKEKVTTLESHVEKLESTISRMALQMESITTVLNQISSNQQHLSTSQSVSWAPHQQQLLQRNALNAVTGQHISHLDPSNLLPRARTITDTNGGLNTGSSLSASVSSLPLPRKRTITADPNERLTHPNNRGTSVESNMSAGEVALLNSLLGGDHQRQPSIDYFNQQQRVGPNTATNAALRRDDTLFRLSSILNEAKKNNNNNNRTTGV